MNLDTQGAPADSRSSAPGVVDRLAGLVLPPHERLGGRGTWLTPMLMGWVIVLVSTWLSQDALLERMQEQSGEAARGMIVGVWTLAGITPLLGLAKGLVLGGGVWAAMVLLGGAPRFVAAVAAVLYADVLLTLQGVPIAFALKAGVEPAALSAFRGGLDAFLPGAGGALGGVLGNVTPFHLAWGVYLALALSTVSQSSRKRAAVVVLGIWCLLTAIAAIRGSFV